MEVYHNIYATAIAHGFIGTAYYRWVPKFISTYSKPWHRYIKKQQRLTKMIRRLIHEKSDTN